MVQAADILIDETTKVQAAEKLSKMFEDTREILTADEQNQVGISPFSCWWDAVQETPPHAITSI